MLYNIKCWKSDFIIRPIGVNKKNAHIVADWTLYSDLKWEVKLSQNGVFTLNNTKILRPTLRK